MGRGVRSLKSYLCNNWVSVTALQKAMDLWRTVEMVSIGYISEEEQLKKTGFATDMTTAIRKHESMELGGLGPLTPSTLV